MKTVAALYVDPLGPYPKMAGVECWDEARDARLYQGPHPVVAHPPCGRWCAMARLNESRWGARVGDDGGCFAAALAALRRCGGVLEHPAFSLAWDAYGLSKPPAFGWQQCLDGTWVCEVKQSAYGHKSRKPTWMLYVGINPPSPALWQDVPGTHYVGGGVRTHNNAKPRLSKREAIHSPTRFAEYLVRLARECGGAND